MAREGCVTFDQARKSAEAFWSFTFWQRARFIGRLLWYVLTGGLCSRCLALIVHAIHEYEPTQV